MRGSISSDMGDLYVKSDDNKKYCLLMQLIYLVSVCQPLPFDEIKFDKNVKLKDILNTNDESVIGYFVEVDLSYPDNIKNKTKTFHLLLKRKKINVIFLVII